MGRYHGHSFTDRVGYTSVGRSRDTEERVLRETAALQRHWGVASCAHCGRTIVIGEFAARVHPRDPSAVLCAECLKPAPAARTWIAAPERNGRVPVRLAKPQSDLSRAA